MVPSLAPHHPSRMLSPHPVPMVRKALQIKAFVAPSALQGAGETRIGPGTGAFSPNRWRSGAGIAGLCSERCRVDRCAVAKIAFGNRLSLGLLKTFTLLSGRLLPQSLSDVMLTMPVVLMAPGLLRRVTPRDTNRAPSRNDPRQRISPGVEIPPATIHPAGTVASARHRLLRVARLCHEDLLFSRIIRVRCRKAPFGDADDRARPPAPASLCLQPNSASVTSSASACTPSWSATSGSPDSRH